MITEKKEPFHWRTSIAYKTKDKIVVRGYDLNELTGKLDFASMAYLVWTGNLPQEGYRLMLNAMLVCLSEHAFSPSSASCRLVCSGGVPLNVAVAGGVLTMGNLHASADIPAAMFRRGVRCCQHENIDVETHALDIVQEHKDRAEILNGYHHPQHIRDPRVQRLLQLAEEYGITGQHQHLAKAIERATEKVYGRFFYLNGPGAIAAIASDMDLSPKQIKGLLILSRTVSLVAHSIEEMEQEKGWRASTRSRITQPLDLSLQLPEHYNGPEQRGLK